MLAEVKYGTTPRAELDTYFGGEADVGAEYRSASHSQHDTPVRPSAVQTPDFKQFILDTSPDLDDELAGSMKQLRSYDDSADSSFTADEAEPDTPRQATMGGGSFTVAR